MSSTASERIREAREAWVCPKCGRPADAHNRGVSCQTLALWNEVLNESRCYCPDDCNCHYPWRTNYCGCKGHAS